MATTSFRAVVLKDGVIVDKPLWICPKCGHPFVTKSMSHSCARHELDDVFRTKPAHIRALFDRFRTMLGPLCGSGATGTKSTSEAA
jgi:predicted RNA-binding protein with PUA domain